MMIELYNRFVESYLKKIKNRNDLKAFFQFGSIKCPGISDLDLIIVFKESIDNGNVYRDLFWETVKENENYRRIIIHEPYFIVENLFEDLTKHHYIREEDLKILYNNDFYYNIKKIDNMEKLIINSEFIYSRLIQFLLSYTTKNYNLKYLLVRGNSIRHSLKLYKDSFPEENIELTSLEKINYLREEFKKNKMLEISENEIDDLFKQNINDFAKIFILSNAKIIENNFYYIKYNKNYKYEYSENISINFTNKLGISLDNNNKIVINLDNGIIPIIGLYKNYSKYVRKYFDVDLEYSIKNQKLLELIKRRVYFINNYWNFNKKCFGFKIGSLGFPMFLNPNHINV